MGKDGGGVFVRFRDGGVEEDWSLVVGEGVSGGSWVLEGIGGSYIYWRYMFIGDIYLCFGISGVFITR